MVWYRNTIHVLPKVYKVLAIKSRFIFSPSKLLDSSMKLFIAQLVCWSALWGKSNCWRGNDYSDSKTQTSHYQNWTSIKFDLFPTRQHQKLAIETYICKQWNKSDLENFLTLREVLNIHFFRFWDRKGFATAKGRRISIRRCKLWNRSEFWRKIETWRQKIKGSHTSADCCTCLPSNIFDHVWKWLTLLLFCVNACSSNIFCDFKLYIYFFICSLKKRKLFR